jgi:hypothetical protein
VFCAEARHAPILPRICQTASEGEGVDMKAVDILLNEMAVMLDRWSLYARFLVGKCAKPEEAADSESNKPTMPKFLLNSTLMKKITDRLITPFNIMTTFFFRRSVEKAFQLDKPLSDSICVIFNNVMKPRLRPILLDAFRDTNYAIHPKVQRVA